MLSSRRLALLAIALLAPCAAQDDAVSNAVAALQQNDLPSAERILRTELRLHPNNPGALDVLGVVLDQEKRFTDADAIYRRAAAAAPRSPSILNNYGNHLLSMGKRQDARAVFLKALALNPADVNACTQVARLALERKSPAEAGCLNRLPASARERRDIEILMMQADYTLGRNADADALLSRVSAAVTPDAGASFSLGVALAGVGQYEKAEAFFLRAVEGAPDNFEALYDLGLAASHAGHKERAQQVLQQALDRQPENVDVLYDLAAVDVEQGHTDTALELLAHAARIAPQRADVQRLLAHTSADLGDFADAVDEWQRYRTLAPQDDIGRREHAFAETALDEHANAALADLRWYAAKHPNEALGHYELGTAESATNQDDALRELNRALELKPDLAAAHAARGLLNYRLSKPSAALADFEFAAQRDPKNARVLDRLGETYATLGRHADALRTLRQAAQLAPDDSTILLHLGRALLSAGKAQEAKAVFARFRELGPNKSALPHPAGLVEFLSLTPEQQFARYRAGVERTIQKDPGNAEAQMRYLELLLQSGNTSEVTDVSRKILALKPSPALLAQAAGAFLAAEQYAPAADFLKQAVELAPISVDLKLDLALVTFHQTGAQAGLEQMAALPASGQNGDYDLARMQMLEAMGKNSEADSALHQALRAKPTHPELYRQMALLLLKKSRASDAIRLLDEGARVLPDDPRIPVLREVAAEVEADPAESERLLREYAHRQSM